MIFLGISTANGKAFRAQPSKNQELLSLNIVQHSMEGGEDDTTLLSARVLSKKLQLTFPRADGEWSTAGLLLAPTNSPLLPALNSWLDVHGKGHKQPLTLSTYYIALGHPLQGIGR